MEENDHWNPKAFLRLHFGTDHWKKLAFRLLNMINVAELCEGMPSLKSY